MSSSQSRLSGAHIAVLGASGFLGARLIAHLDAMSTHVTAFARGAATSVVMPPGVRTVFGDVRETSEVLPAIEGADVIFLLAGRSGAAASFRDSNADLSTNAGGLLSVLDAVVSLGSVPKLIFPGSRLEYGRVASLPVSEDAPLRPTSPYGAHKALCEEYLRMYAERFGVRYAVARLTNPYGPWKTLAARGYNIVTQMIARALTGETIDVYGDGAQLRDYIYVDDAIEALIALVQAPDGTVANVGSGVGVSVAQAADTIVRLSGSGVVRRAAWPLDAERIETGDFVADVSRMLALGWEPTTSFEDGVHETIAWLRSISH